MSRAQTAGGERKGSRWFDGSMKRLQSLGSKQDLKKTSLPFLFTYIVSKAGFVLGKVEKKNKWSENIELTAKHNSKNTIVHF